MTVVREADTFTCSHCGNTYEKGWSDEEALNETGDNFGFVPPEEELDVLCDVCYEEFMEWWEEESE